MPWCTRAEIRELSNEAQKICDAIRHGHLLIHTHADDGHTTVAVGTYLNAGGKSIHLHGENHLRQVADTFDSPAQALVAFEKTHGDTMRPGPAPTTDIERDADQARTAVSPTALKPTPPPVDRNRPRVRRRRPRCPPGSVPQRQPGPPRMANLVR